jgi:hypothetical protein
MVTLEKEMNFQGRALRQIKRIGMIAVYEVYGLRRVLYGFEVIVIRVRQAEEAFGRAYPEREVYPSSEEWGTYGFTFLARDPSGAQKRVLNLLPKWGENVSNAKNNAVSASKW